MVYSAVDLAGDYWSTTGAVVVGCQPADRSSSRLRDSVQPVESPAQSSRSTPLLPVVSGPSWSIRRWSENFEINVEVVTNR